MASKSLVFAKLLRSNRSFTAAASSFAGRYHSFSSSAAPKDHTCTPSSRRIVLHSPSWAARIKDPFKNQGLRMLCNIDEYELEAIVRVDFPGIDKQSLNLEIGNNAIHIKGLADKEPPQCYETMVENMVEASYSGVVELPPGFYNTDQIKASVTFGFLKIVIPKLKPEEMKDASLIPPPIEFHRGPCVPVKW